MNGSKPIGPLSKRGDGHRNIDISESVESCSLSLRERVRVRGNETLFIGRRWTFPATVELCGHSSRAGGFLTSS